MTNLEPHYVPVCDHALLELGQDWTDKSQLKPLLWVSYVVFYWSFLNGQLPQGLAAVEVYERQVGHVEDEL